MIRLFTIVLMVLLCHIINAQSIFETKENTANISKVNLDFKFADSINVRVWNKDEILIKAIVNINNNQNNDKFTFKTEKLGKKILIKSEIKDLNKLGKEKKVKDLETGEIIEMNCHIKMDLFFEVFIPQNLSLDIETISGNINSTHTKGNQRYHTISGDIDFNLPEKATVDLEMKTISGEMYTNFELTSDKDGLNHFVSSEINTSLNGGGNNIELETISGNIYLRKIE